MIRRRVQKEIEVKEDFHGHKFESRISMSTVQVIEDLWNSKYIQSKLDCAIRHRNIYKYLIDIIFEYIRKGQVTCNEGKEAVTPIGVLQGLVLGPTLWNLFPIYWSIDSIDDGSCLHNSFHRRFGTEDEGKKIGSNLYTQ